MSNTSLPGRRTMLLGAAAIAAGLSREVSARSVAEGPWAIELFTSQGCSSCPPADAHLGRLSKRPDIVALAFHVDYWDYIGWRDPFASRETTERQRAYARTLKQRYVYTPEMVVDGIGHDTGRDRAPIEALLTRAQARATRRATPDLSRSLGGPLSIKLDAFPLGGRVADVTLAIYDRRHTTPVKSGENQGRMIENFNTVRHIELVDRWDGTARSWTIPGDRIGPTQGIAVLVQETDHGPMIGCNKLEPAYSG